MAIDRKSLLGISLVIPAYNEAAVIGQAVQEAYQALERHFPQFELIVVDDGSRDGTAEIVQDLTRYYPQLQLIRHDRNRGYGAALRTGFRAARMPLVAFTDADCQFDLNDLALLAMRSSEFPIVAGYRAYRQDPWLRCFLSRGYNWLVRWLFGVRLRDIDCALKVFHRTAVRALLPRSRGFLVNTEMMVRAQRLGMPIAELPVRHRRRAGGISKVGWREVPRTAYQLLRLWLTLRRERVAGHLPGVVWSGTLRAGPARTPLAAAAPTPMPPPSTVTRRPTAVAAPVREAA